MYPNIHNYLESITDKCGLFRTLTSVTLPLNESGKPYMISGNFSVIFKVIINDRPMALKCFIREHTHSPLNYQLISDYLSKFKTESSPFIEFSYLEDELYVFNDYGRGNWYSVVLMEWIEGETLGNAINFACKTNNKLRLSSLATEFDRIALWLQQHLCSHGDLKFDNIVVDDSGKMHLIDYDGLYVPGINNRYSTQLGTHDFQHRLRDMLEVGEHTDDYSIIVISATLHAVADFPHLFKDSDWSTTPLFDAPERLEFIFKEWLHSGASHLVNLLILLDSPTPEIDYLPTLLSNLNRQRALSANGELIPFRRAGRFGYEDCEGEYIAPIFDMAEEFVDQYALVRLAGRNMIIDKECRVRSDLSQYRYVEIVDSTTIRISTDAINWQFANITNLE